MAALVEREALVLAAQRQAYEIPGMRVEPAAVQEKDRMAPRSAPIEVVETHPVDHDVVVLGKRETRPFEPGDLGGQLQVLELFRCFQHVSLSSRSIWLCVRRAGSPTVRFY